MKSVDWSAPIQTRGGRPARMISKSADVKMGGGTVQPIVAVVTFEYGENLRSFNADGSFYPDGHTDDDDIINVPKPIEVFLNLYPASSCAHTTAITAQRVRCNDRIALYKFTFSQDGILKSHERIQ